MILRSSLVCLLFISVFLSGLSANAGTITITPENSSQVHFIGGKLNLACFAQGHLLGTLSAKKVQTGATFKAFRAQTKIKQFKKRLATATSKRRTLLKIKIRQIKAASRFCANWQPPSSAHSSSGSSSSISISAASSSSISLQTAQSISQYGITWTFDKAYPVGQFVNGDWWVVGPVTVTTVDPAPTGSGGTFLNGSEKNPKGGAGQQGFDGRTYNFSAAKSVVFPVSLTPGARLVSTIGIIAPDDDQTVDSAAVLTVVPNPPPSLTFRPPYSGWDGHTYYSAADLRLDLLPALDPVEHTPTLAEATRKFERVWLDHEQGWSAAGIFPVSNMSGYGREIANDVGIAAAMLLLDPAKIGDKTELARLLVQNGIDHYGMLLDGRTWYPDGGHASGRKFPILFAGLMLNEPDMLNIGSAYPPNAFGEDGTTIIVDQNTVDEDMDIEISGLVSGADSNTIIVENVPGYTILHGNYIDITSGPGAGQRRYIESDNLPWAGGFHTAIATLSQPWTAIPVVGQSTYQVVGYEASMIGTPEWTGADYINYLNRANPSWFQPYRQCCTAVAWNGYALAALILNLKATWNHDPFFAYEDRYMQVTVSNGAHPGWRSWSTFTEEMWDAYRNSFHQ